MEQLLPEVDRVFGNWNRGAAKKKHLADVAATNETRVYVMDKPDAPQSVIIAAHLSEHGGQPDDLAKIEPGVRELDYGEVIRLDEDGQPAAH